MKSTPWNCDKHGQFDASQLCECPACYEILYRAIEKIWQNDPDSDAGKLARTALDSVGSPTPPDIVQRTHG